MEVTLCTVSFNACDALALMWESWQKYHPDVPCRWLVYDNGSTDGALEYACEHADTVLRGDNSLGHGECLSALCRAVDTPLLLSVDNDIEFLAPVYGLMRPHLQLPGGVDGSAQNYCVCLTRLGEFGYADIFGSRYRAQWSPNIALGLMRTDRVQAIQDAGITFGYYLNHTRQEFFETGALFYRVASACGWTVVEMPELWNGCKHYGQISTLWLNDTIDPHHKEPDYLPEIRRRYAIIGERLKELRTCTQV